MVTHKETSDVLKYQRHYPNTYSGWVELFEALRNVARAAEDCIYGKEPLSVDEADLKTQLNTLPAWVLEED